MHIKQACSTAWLIIAPSAAKYWSQRAEQRRQFAKSEGDSERLAHPQQRHGRPAALIEESLDRVIAAVPVEGLAGHGGDELGAPEPLGSRSVFAKGKYKPADAP